MPNIEVTLKDRFGTPVATTLTDGNGRYLFTGVTPGTGYYVEVTGGLTAGLSQTFPIPPGLNKTTSFNLVGGQSYTSADLGYRASGGTASFGDQVWVDANADGIRNAGEIGLGGVTLTLYRDANGNGLLDIGTDTLVGTTVSAPGGTYLFTGAPATGSETYFVSATTPSGYLTTGATNYKFTNVAAGSTLLTADFGFNVIGPAITYSIKDRVWTDTNGDGLFSGENGIAGVTIELLDASLNVIGTTSTAADGSFIFTGLPGGGADYTVRINDTGGVLLDYYGTTSYALALKRAESNLVASIDRVATPPPSYGFRPLRSIGDTIFNDLGGTNGVQDAGEPGISGVVVSLYKDINGDGRINVTAGPGTASVPINSAAVTGTGTTFTNYRAGNPITINTVPFTILSITDNTHLTLTTNSLVAVVNQAYYAPPAGPGTVSVPINSAAVTGTGTTFTNYRAGEPITINNVPFTILSITDATHLTLTTNSLVAVVNQAYYGAPADPGTVTTFAASPAVTGVGGTTFTQYRAGEPITIAGVTYTILSITSDTSLTLTTNYAGGAGAGRIYYGPGDTLISSVTTDAAGQYLFSGLADRNYIVSVATPSGYNFVANGAVNPDTDVTTAGIQNSATMAGGVNVLDKDFGFRAPVQRTVSGTIWDDLDADGVIDGGESLLANVTLEVRRTCPAPCTLVATVTTNASGAYSVAGLVNDNSYTVFVTDTNSVLTGYNPTFEYDVGTAGPFDNKAPVDLTGGDVSTVNFGFKIPAPTLVTISDFRAYEEDGQLVIEWTTESEMGTAGFYLYRLNEVTGQYDRLNEALLPGLITEPQGGTYRLVDKGTAPYKSNTYLLEEVEGKGSKNLHGPYEAGHGAGQAKATIQKSAPAIATAGAVLTTDSTGVQIFTIRGTQKAYTPEGEQLTGYSREPHPGIARGEVTMAKTLGSTATVAAQQTGDQIRISVTEDGLYSLTAVKIAELLGMGLKDVTLLLKNRTLNLSYAGQNVAYEVLKDNSGLQFYGKQLKNNYTDEAIYWLKKSLGQKMTTTVATGSLPIAGGSFTETKRYEKNAFTATALFTDPEADYWFWDYLVAGDAVYGKKSYTLNAPGISADSGTATLTVRLQGATDSLTGKDHHAVISLNGTTLPGEGQWKGTTGKTLTYSFNQNMLKAADNTLEIKGTLDSGVPYSIFYVNNIDLKYNRLYSAENNRLQFRAEQTTAVTVSGFSVPEISLYDLTDPLKPILVTGGTVSNSSGNYSLSFVPKGSNTPYLGVAQNGIIPATAGASTSTTLRSKSNKADYLIITKEPLKTDLQRLATYRQGQGFKTMTVLVEQVMDEFGFGNYNPNAIKEFLVYAYRNWATPPKYVLLAGSGTYDYKDNRKFGGNLVPVLMVGTPDGLFPSDTRYADMDGDGVPDLFMGRMPAANAAEVNTLIDKVIGYESGPGGSWAQRVVAAADDKDTAGDFPSDRDAVAALLPAGYTAQKVTVGEKPLTEVRTQMFGWIKDGAGMLNYVGHGAWDRMAQEGLLTIVDVGSMTNAVQPFVAGMTCVIGNYGMPGVELLSEALVLRPGGGAIAVWSPTGMSLNKEAVELDKKLVRKMYERGGPQRAGEIVTRAIKDYAKGGGMKFMIDIYNLLGDPALILKK
jgi:hypothetical protein